MKISDKIGKGNAASNSIKIICILSAMRNIFMARKHSNDIGILFVCLSVRPSVRPSRSGIVSKRLNVSSNFLQHNMAAPLF